MKYGNGSSGGLKPSGSAKSMKPGGGKASTSVPGGGKPTQSTLRGYGSAKTALTAKTPSGKRLGDGK